MLRSGVYGAILGLVAYLIWSYWPTSCLCKIPGRLTDKVVLITDANSFTAREAAGEFARRGATVLLGASSLNEFHGVVHSLLMDYSDNGERKNTDIADPLIASSLTPIKESQFKYFQVQMDSLESVRRFAREVMKDTEKLHYLINTAMPNHGRYRLTKDNFESVMAISHLAHYLLVELLTPLLLKTRPNSKIIIITSAEHYSGSYEDQKFFIPRYEFNSVVGLRQSKLANVIHGVILAEKFKETSVIPVSIHPGYVLPNIGLLVPALFGSFFKTRWEASQTILQAALASDLVPGGYYSECQLTEPNYEVKNETIVEFIRSESNRLLSIPNTKQL